MPIQKGTAKDIDELEALYNDLNDYLAANTNHPGWIKGIYPVRETAMEAIEEENLFVYRIGSTIAGSIILNHKPEDAYKKVQWNFDNNYQKIIVIHTLVVHPQFMNKGIASQLMQFAREYAKEHNFKSIRLDVSVNNTPAISLYEKHGYQYIGTVDLGLPYEHLKWFKLYELLL